MNRNIALFAVLLVVSLLLGGCKSTKDTKKSDPFPTKFPTTISQWPDEDDELFDKVTFFKAIDASSYEKITVVPSDFSKMVVDEKDGKDTSPIDPEKVANAKVFQKWFDPILVDNLTAGASNLSIPLVAADSPTSGIVLKATLLTADTGNSWARAFAGFGAGKARFKVQIDLIDAKTQEVLVSTFFSKSDWGGSTSSSNYRLPSKTVLDNWHSYNEGQLMLVKAEDKFAKENVLVFLQMLFPKKAK